jgi:hypothetical protein
MKIKRFSAASFVVFLFAFSIPAWAQLVTMGSFDIAPPTLLADVKALRQGNPKMTTPELLEAANGLLAKQGVPFTFTFDAATCDAIDKGIKALKNAPPRVNLRTKLSSVGGEPATLTLPPADFTNNACGKCSVTLPVLEITETEFVALMWGRNIKFTLPANLKPAEAALVDAADAGKVKTKWRLPYRSKPLGVSYDGGVIYLALPDPDLKDLALAVFREGVFQFTTRADAESNGTAKPSPPTPAIPAITNPGSILFDNRGTKQLVQYAETCQQ